jgi:hypothetical protein
MLASNPHCRQSWSAYCSTQSAELHPAGWSWFRPPAESLPVPLPVVRGHRQPSNVIRSVVNRHRCHARCQVSASEIRGAIAGVVNRQPGSVRQLRSVRQPARGTVIGVGRYGDPIHRRLRDPVSDVELRIRRQITDGCTWLPANSGCRNRRPGVGSAQL